MMINISEITAILKTRFAKTARAITKKADDPLNAFNKNISDGLSGNPNSTLSREVDRMNKKTDELAEKGRSKIQSLTVDNKPAKTTTEEKSSGTSSVKQDFKDALMEHHNATKNDQKKTVTVNAQIEKDASGSYLLSEF
jgi:hypothetical protein